MSDKQKKHSTCKRTRSLVCLCAIFSDAKQTKRIAADSAKDFELREATLASKRRSIKRNKNDT